MNYHLNDIVSFPLDHIYAVPSTNATPDYDNLKNDYDSLKNDYDNLKNNYGKVKNDYGKIKRDYDNLRIESETLKSLVQAHLDLIQKQNDIAVERDKVIGLYKDQLNKYKIRVERAEKRNKPQCQRNPPPLIHIPSSNQQTSSLAVASGSLTKPKLGEFPEHRVSTSTSGPSSGIIFIRQPTIRQETMTVSSRQDTARSTKINSNRSIEDGPEPFRKNLNTQPITYSKRSHISTNNVLEPAQTTTSQANKMDLLPKQVAVNKPNAFSKCKMIYSYNIKQGPDNRINVNETKTINKPYDFCETDVLDHITDNTSSDQSITLHKGFQESNNSNVLLQSSTIKMEALDPCSSKTDFSTLKSRGDMSFSKKTFNDNINKLKRPVIKNKPLSNIKSSDLNPSRIKEEPKLKNDNFFSSWGLNKKMETSCRDYSYGETINNLTTNILPSVDRRNRDTNSLIRGLYMADDDDDDIFFKRKSIMPKPEPKISKPDPVLIQKLQTPKETELVKPKTKPRKRNSRKRPTTIKPPSQSQVTDPNILIRGMFMADDSRDHCDDDKKQMTMSNLFGDDSISDGFSEPHLEEKPKLKFTCYADAADKKEPSLIGKKKDYFSAFFGSDSSADVYELNVNEPSKPPDKVKRRFGCFGEETSIVKKKETSAIRKRTFSTCSRSSTTSQSDVVGIGARAFSTTQFKMNPINNKPLQMLTTDEPYYTNMSALPASYGPPDNSSILEVPSWRILETLQSSKIESSDEAECLDDAIFAKRHLKMEIEEKRIKRRDYQRLKEQELLKKLKERQEKTSFVSKKTIAQRMKPPSILTSLWPSMEDAQFIQVEDTIPVAAFGEFVPNFGKRAFSLPWIKQEKHKRSKKKSRRHEKD